MPACSPRIAWWYRLTVPWLWLNVALISWRHPGDEYGLFGVANGLPSAWVSLLLGNLRGMNDTFIAMIAFSFVSMALLSWLLDRLRVPLVIFLPLYAAGAFFLVGWALSGYESYDRAMMKNGSLTAYVSAASNFALFATSVLCVVGFAVWRCLRRRKPAP